MHERIKEKKKEADLRHFSSKSLLYTIHVLVSLQRVEFNRGTKHKINFVYAAFLFVKAILTGNTDE